MFKRRELLPGEDFYTKIPNHWIRDHRLPGLSFRVLCFWVSHEVGYQVTMEQTLAELNEGRDAIYTAIRKLVNLGYIRRAQARGADGKHGQMDYELGEAAYEQLYIRNWGKAAVQAKIPGQTRGSELGDKTPGQPASWETGSGQPEHKIPGQAASGETVYGEAVNGSPGSGDPATKKNNPLEDQGLEEQKTKTPPTPRSSVASTSVVTDAKEPGGEEIPESETPERQTQDLINELKVIMSQKLNGVGWKWLDQRTRAALAHMKDDNHPFPVIRLALLYLANDTFGPTASPMRVVEAGPWWDKAYADYRKSPAGYSADQRPPCEDCDGVWLLEPDRGPGTRRLPLEPPMRCTHAVRVLAEAS